MGFPVTLCSASCWIPTTLLQSPSFNSSEYDGILPSTTYFMIS
jgi:hypothetical protein